MRWEGRRRNGELPLGRQENLGCWGIIDGRGTEKDISVKPTAVCVKSNIFRQLHPAQMGHGSCWFFPPLILSNPVPKLTYRRCLGSGTANTRLKKIPPKTDMRTPINKLLRHNGRKTGLASTIDGVIIHSVSPSIRVLANQAWWIWVRISENTGTVRSVYLIVCFQ